MTYQILHQRNCKSSYIIYLSERLKCHLQYVGKSETEFNIRLNSHRIDNTKKDSTPASNHFNIEGHNLNIQDKYTLIEKLNQTNMDNLTLRQRLKIRKNFWILKLETLHSKGLNRELNKIYLHTSQFLVDLLNRDF